MGLLEDIYGPKVEEPTESSPVYEYQNTPENRSWAGALPVKQGLYDPELEKDSCGVGFAAYVFAVHLFPMGRPRGLLTIANSNIKGKASHKIVSDGMPILQFLSSLHPIESVRPLTPF
jgi:glutamate synthase (NADPH/NADH)